MADNRFPLFRLPFLALCMIMDLYGPHEIIQLSFCSKRSLRVAKKCWKKRAVVETYLYVKRIPSVNVHFLDFRFYSRFVILKARDLKDQQSHNIKIGDAVVPTIHEETETVTYWEDTILGIEHIVSFIKDLFDVPITKIYLNSEGYKNEFIDTMDCIMKVQKSVQDCTLDTISPIEECLTHLLDRCKITGELAIHQEPARQFRNEWNIHLDSMYITSGPCISFQNLTNIDCRFLELHHSSLTSEDANQFLKHWQNGGNSRMRYARIGINSMKRDVVTSGIETVPQPETLRRLYSTIQLSLCSKRSLRVANKCWKKKRLVTANLDVREVPRINLHFDDTPFYYRFVILQSKDLQNEQTHNVRVADAVAPSIHKETETVTYWNDKIFGIGQVVSYIKDLFDVPITTIYLTVEENQNEILDTMDCIMSRQESVQDCILRSENSIDDCLTNLLDNCKITGDLMIVGRLSTEFRHDWNISLDGLHVSKVLSFTFQNLMNIDCQALDLYSSSLTSEDLNQFLKHWQSGGSPRIRFASIMINSMNHDIVTSGIETVPLPQGMSRSYPHMRNSKMMISVGLDIKRNDGKIGTIHLFENSFGFGVDPIEVFNY